MANKYIMLECNRLRANTNYKNIDEEEDIFKNEWTNNVNSYGIVCNVGDVITCESSAINTVGASDTTIEFLQKENKNGYLDNQCQIEFGFYVCDSGTNLVKLPLKLNELSLGPISNGAGANPSHRYFTLGSATFPTTLQYQVRNSMIGEYALDLQANIQPFLPQSSNTGLYSNERMFPQTQLVTAIKLSVASTKIGFGYRVGGLYNVPEVEGQGGEGMVIKVLEVINEVNKNGIPSKIEIHTAGSDYEIDEYEIGNASDGGSNPDGSPFQAFKILSFHNNQFTSRVNIGPSGKKYYFPSNHFTGPYQIAYNGIPTDDPASNSFGNKSDIFPDFNIRSTTVNLEVPVGLNTPDNVGAILTEQMQKGKIVKPSDNLDYINYDQYTVLSVNAQDASVTVKPPLVETPCYKAMPSNGNGNVTPITNANQKSFFALRQLYYNKIGYLDPYKLKGLYKFNQWEYGLTNSVITNEINTGFNQVGGIGNFANQEIGNLGQFSSIMMDLDFETDDSGHQFAKLKQNGILLTNIYYREETLKAIAEGFRQCEEYYDDLTQKYKTPLDTTKLAVNMDLARYGVSDAYPLTNGASVGTRSRIKQPVERWSNTGGSPNGFDAVNITGAKGNIPFRSRIYDDQLKDNDGGQLSQLIVRSRFDPTLYFQPEDAQAGVDSIFLEYWEKVSGAGSVDQNYYENANVITDHFINSYTEPTNGITYQTTDLIKLAEKYDLAVIPIFPPTTPNIDFNPNGDNRPYIGFYSRYELGNGNIDNDTLAGTIQKWRIDKASMPYGCCFGYDPSPIRNPQALFYNTNYADINNLAQANAYNQVAFMGAVNPTVNFNPALSRFEFKGLNTPMTIGNGLPTDDQFDLEATGNPEQQCYNCNTTGQIASTIDGTFAPQVRQMTTRFVDSYSGLGIISINLLDELGNIVSLNKTGTFGGAYSTATGITAPTKFPSDILDGTLLGKMGFKIGQLLPEYGSVFANYKDPVVFLTNIQNQNFQTYLNRLDEVLSPMTTGAVIDSPEYQPTETNQQDMPLYGIGTNMGLPARPAVVQASLTAQDLPTKLDYPYLLVYSSIIQGGTDTQYYGGLDGKSKLPCVGYITRNYNNGDFFYSLEQSFNYTCTKSFTLTEIKTEIRLPDGSRPRLQPHNSVIYKITKPMALPEFELPPQPTDSKKSTKKKKIGDGDMP